MDQATDKAIEGRNRPRNPGVPLDPAWFESVGVNASAVERRAATLTTRRSVKKEYQAAWLVKAMTCIDLTTLSGDDTPERVRRLCAKARRPLSGELLDSARARRRAPDRRRRLRLPDHGRRRRSGRSKARGFRSRRSRRAFPPASRPLKVRLDEIRYAVSEGAARDRHRHHPRPRPRSRLDGALRRGRGDA